MDAVNSSEETKSGTQSLQRAVALMRSLVGFGRQGASVAELAVAAGVERSTAHRMLKRLAQEGLLSTALNSRRYVFGPLAYEIGLVAADHLDLRSMALPAMRRIAEHTGDTVFLLMRSGDDSVCAERVEGTYPVKTFVVDVGTRRPLGAGAGSMAILAALSPEDADATIQRNQEAFRQYPEITSNRLQRTLSQTREAGHSFMAVLHLPGVHALGVAIRTAAGRSVAALSVAAISARLNANRRQEILNVLKEEAQGIGARLS
jgi:DNA-binding IclR family transcriptional regulator